MKQYQRQPCAECPWRQDIAPGRFPAKRFEELAYTAYDMSIIQFACHLHENIGCAGFVLRGSLHNLGARLAISHRNLDPTQIKDGGYQLYNNYREMAIANGVSPDDPKLEHCRSNDPLT